MQKFSLDKALVAADAAYSSVKGIPDDLCKEYYYCRNNAVQLLKQVKTLLPPGTSDGYTGAGFPLSRDDISDDIPENIPDDIPDDGGSSSFFGRLSDGVSNLASSASSGLSDLWSNPSATMAAAGANLQSFGKRHVTSARKALFYARHTVAETITGDPGRRTKRVEKLVGRMEARIDKLNEYRAIFKALASEVAKGSRRNADTDNDTAGSNRSQGRHHRSISPSTGQTNPVGTATVESWGAPQVQTPQQMSHQNSPAAGNSDDDLDNDTAALFRNGPSGNHFVLRNPDSMSSEAGEERHSRVSSRESNFGGDHFGQMGNSSRDPVSDHARYSPNRNHAMHPGNSNQRFPPSGRDEGQPRPFRPLDRTSPPIASGGTFSLPSFGHDLYDEGRADPLPRRNRRDNDVRSQTYAGW